MANTIMIERIMRHLHRRFRVSISSDALIGSHDISKDNWGDERLQNNTSSEDIDWPESIYEASLMIQLAPAAQPTRVGRGCGSEISVLAGTGSALDKLWREK